MSRPIQTRPVRSTAAGLLRSHPPHPLWQRWMYGNEYHLPILRSHRRQATGTLSAGLDHAPNWSFNVGLRGDLYNGLAIAREAQPRVGVAYSIKQTNTVLRASYARTLETPFNENLVLSSTGCNYPVIAALVPCIPSAFNPGFRNEFHVGTRTGLRKISRRERRIYLEVHSRFIRLQRPRSHSHHLPYRVA